MNTSTHTYLIVTQTLENYGAHDKDGRFSSGNAYWKFKGGDEYIITGLDRIQDAVAYVAAKCSNNIGYKEFPTSWEEVSADYQTEFEKSQMEYEGEIRHPANRINVADELKQRQPRLDREHGSPYDRGHADSYYRRQQNPHGYEGGTDVSPMLTNLFPEEVALYTQGYMDNEASGDFKDYGWGGHRY